jgi:hypothetical protein
VLAGSLLVAFVVFRVSFVQAVASSHPSRAGKVWPGHPSVIMEAGLAEIGEAAATARPIDPALVHRLLLAATKVPLAPEPFLVRGVAAQLAGNQRLALQSFLAARERSPRNVAVRYFMADQYLRNGQVGPGLTEISILARLVPQSLPNFAPFLAAYARSPDAAPQIRAVLRAHPQLEAPLLDALSTDASNADLILELWSGRGGEQSKNWQGRLLNQLVEAGRYGLARVTWAKFTGIVAEPGRLFDPEFSKRTLPPFGWNLASGSSGVADPDEGGRLHILYYGRDDVGLASQILALKPGRYRLSMKVETAAPTSKSLGWTVKCLPSSTDIAVVRLDRTGAVSGSFSVPPEGCAAQRLELRGTAPEFPEQADVTISAFGLQPEAGL